MNKNDLLELAQKGDANAQLQLGHLFEAKGIDRDFQQAFKWFKKSAEQGLAEAQFLCGDAYWSGFGVTQDYQEASKWLRKAAKQEHSYAQFLLSLMYYFGNGMPFDDRQSLKWAMLRDLPASLAIGSYHLCRTEPPCINAGAWNISLPD